ncbi:MAG TPA: amidohydrolase [Candidatus Polarisedimenticolia bacterium]
MTRAVATRRSLGTRRSLAPRRSLVLLVPAILAACAGGGVPAEQADLVLRHARIYTADPSRPWAEAVAVREGRIAGVGGEAEVAGLVSPKTRVIDAGGRLVMPGFIDSHNHITFGSDPEVLQLGEARDPKDLYDRLRRFATAHPGLLWIEGEGWNYSIFPGGALPTWRDLEGLTNDRPAFLVSYDVHTVWLNRAGLKKLGVVRGTTSLPFGEVDVDPRTGEATGILRSFATMGLSTEGNAALRKVLPSASTERRYARLKRNLEIAVRFGITTIVEPQAFLEDLPLFSRARQEGLLRPRLQLALFHPRGTTEADLDRYDEARRQFNDDHLRVAAIKLYIDDVVEPHTAALLQPYSDAPSLKGETLYTPEEFKTVAARLDRLKFQMFIHAIGDRGIRVALDALQFARESNGARDSRHELIHIECLSPEDLPRFKALGVTACMQPRHCAPDITGKWAMNIGPERSRYAWAFRSLKEAGATLAFASDWNVAEMDPLVGIYTALTRQGLDGRPPGGWIPEQTIDLETALRAYTIQGAWANFVEGSRGSIAVGKYADLILLADDLFALPPAKIKDTRVLLTLVGGEEVYRSPDAKL